MGHVRRTESPPSDESSELGHRNPTEFVNLMLEPLLTRALELTNFLRSKPSTDLFLRAVSESRFLVNTTENVLTLTKMSLYHRLGQEEAVRIIISNQMAKILYENVIPELKCAVLEEAARRIYED